MGWESNNYAFEGTDEVPGSMDMKNGIELNKYTTQTSTCSKKELVDDNEPQGETYMKVKGRRFIIEPVLFMLHVFHISSFTLTGQYLYYAIGEKRNLTAWLEAAAEESKGLNDTGPGTGVCGMDKEQQMNSTAYKLQQETQAETAKFNFYMDLTSDIPGFFILLFFGTLIDRFGRKPGMIIPMVGIIFRALFYVAHMIFKFPVEFILITGITDALSGGFSTIISSCYAVYADTLPPEKRAKRMAVADVVYGFFLAGMMYAVGFMITTFGFLIPMLCILPGHFINLIYIVFFVPESRKTNTQKKSISPKYVLQSFKVLLAKRPNNGRTLLLLFVAAWLTLGFTREGKRLETIYKLNSPFCWTAEELGAVRAFSSIVMNVVQIFVALLCIKPLGDVTVVVIALVSDIGDNIMTGLATKSWMLLAAPLIGCMAGMQMPLLRSIMSRCVMQGEQGALYASVAAIDRVLGLGSSSFFSFLYAETLYIFKGTVFLVVACLSTIGTILLIIFKVASQRAKEKAESDQTLVVKEPESNTKLEKF